MGFTEDQAKAALQHATTLEEAISLIIEGNAPIHPTEEQLGSAVSGEYKMVLCCRSDLQMSPGKLAAQCAHAALGCARGCSVVASEAWEQAGEAIITLRSVPLTRADYNQLLYLNYRCDGAAEELERLQQIAHANQLPTYMVKDAGRTEVASGTITVLGIGPAPVEQVDVVTSHLGLY